MEQHTKIIEFYGLPGCGKTTLTDYMINTFNTDVQKEYGRINVLLDNYKRLSFLNELSSIPFKAWILSLKFILSVPRIPLKKWKLYRSFFYISLVYSSKKHFSTPQFILVDHGLFQSALSIIYGHSSTLSGKSWSLLFKLASALDIDFAVRCKIPVKTSFQRIRKRNRQNNGRLDMISDDSKLLELLGYQDTFFDEVSSMCLKLPKTQSLVIQTDYSVNFIAKELTNKLIKK